MEENMSTGSERSVGTHLSRRSALIGGAAGGGAADQGGAAREMRTYRPFTSCAHVLLHILVRRRAAATADDKGGGGARASTCWPGCRRSWRSSGRAGPSRRRRC